MNQKVSVFKRFYSTGTKYFGPNDLLVYENYHIYKVESVSYRTVPLELVVVHTDTLPAKLTSSGAGTAQVVVHIVVD